MCHRTDTCSKCSNDHTNPEKICKNSREVEVDAEEIVDANSDVENGENEEIRCERPPQNRGIKKELIERCKIPSQEAQGQHKNQTGDEPSKPKNERVGITAANAIMQCK